MPLEEYAKPDMTGTDSEPWSTFTAARAALESQDRAKAIAYLQSVTEMDGLESRIYLQAWQFLRQLDVKPPEQIAKHLYGVVVEAGLDTGLEVVAAYTDLSARYLNYTGSVIIWEPMVGEVETVIQALLDAARSVVAQIGPWEGERRPAPPKDYVRVSMLTPSGIHFGEGRMDVLAADPMGGPMIAAATELVTALVDFASAHMNR